MIGLFWVCWGIFFSEGEVEINVFHHCYGYHISGFEYHCSKLS